MLLACMYIVAFIIGIIDYDITLLWVAIIIALLDSVSGYFLIKGYKEKIEHLKSQRDIVKRYDEVIIDRTRQKLLSKVYNSSRNPADLIIHFEDVDKAMYDLKKELYNIKHRIED